MSAIWGTSLIDPAVVLGVCILVELRKELGASHSSSCGSVSNRQGALLMIQRAALRDRGSIGIVILASSTGERTARDMDQPHSSHTEAPLIEEHFTTISPI